MTTFEHAFLGIQGSLALGLHQTHGWKIVALAGFCAVAPDWDGLPMLIDMARFEHGHRVWGHNILTCLVLGVIVGSVDYRLDISGRIGQWISRRKRLKLEFSAQRREVFTYRAWGLWIATASVAALTQIPADIVVSGGQGLTDWALKPYWPFSQKEIVYAMVPWGNVGVTVIFAVAMIAQARRQGQIQPIAIL